MKLNNDTAQIICLHGLDEVQALERTTHLAVGAHPDDLEIMACHGILECLEHPDKWFTGVVVTDGRSSPRSGKYAGCTDEEMVTLRQKEQIGAAEIGGYTVQFLLDYPSGAVAAHGGRGPVDDLVRILEVAGPDVVYTHNLADKHETHVGVALRTIEAIRRIPPSARPAKLYGCEVWRSLDWMVDRGKAALDVSARQDVQAALLQAFESQISGGKRYDLAALGRRRANATYLEAHHVDETAGITLAMDLSRLVEDDELDPHACVEDHLRCFSDDVLERISRLQRR